MGGSNHSKLQLPRETRHHLLHPSCFFDPSHHETVAYRYSTEPQHVRHVKERGQAILYMHGTQDGLHSRENLLLVCQRKSVAQQLAGFGQSSLGSCPYWKSFVKILHRCLGPKGLGVSVYQTRPFHYCEESLCSFVSSYQDWLVRAGKRRDQVPFPIFLSLYKSRNFSSYRYSPIDHIDPITTFCKFNQVGYTSVLRVEEQPLWYNAFLETYGLDKDMETFMASGNRIFSHALQPTLNVSEYIPVILGRQPWPGEEMKSSHHRGSANKLLEYYTTPELVDQVSRLFWEDFVHFQYPLWDGNPETFRYT